MRCIAALLVVIIGAGNAGCIASRFVSEVDSFSQTSATAKTRYVLLPGQKGLEETDLQFVEFSTYIDQAMQSRGYVKADAGRPAELTIFLSYGIGDPQTNQRSYAMPVFGQTGVSSSQTYGSFSTFGGTGTYSGTTTYTPTYGITGYQSSVQSYTTYTRFLFIAAYDVTGSTDKKPLQLWRTEVTSTGNSNDLRHVFPYMVEAMKPYLATNTGKKITVEIPEDDPKVLHLVKSTAPQHD